MRAIALQLGEGELHSACLLKVAGERDARPHDAVQPAPAEHRDESEHADGDQQFDQGQPLVSGLASAAVRPTYGAFGTTWASLMMRRSVFSASKTLTSTRRKKGFGVVYTFSSHTRCNSPCGQSNLR